MNRTFLFIILCLWIIIGAWICRMFFCGPGLLGAAGDDDNEPVKEKIVQQVVEKAAAPIGKWRIADGSFSVAAPEFYQFNKSGFSLVGNNQPTNTEIKKVANYLKTNGQRQLNVTGYYQNNETNGSIFPNIGLARANEIKNLLVNYGAPSGQISTNAKLLGATNSNWMKGNLLTHGVDFSFSKFVDNASTRIQDIKSRLFGKPITLYFQTGSNQLNINAQQRTDFSDLIYYLDNVPSSKLDVDGHTDSTGNRTSNINLSKERAKFVRNYLTQNGGIQNNRMNANGFGPDKPIASNGNASGRAKNRRVEVTLI